MCFKLFRQKMQGITQQDIMMNLDLWLMEVHVLGFNLYLLCCRILLNLTFNPLTPGKLKKSGTNSSTKWPFLSPVWSSLVPILAKSAFYSINSCRFVQFQDVFWHFDLCTIQKFESFLTRKTLSSMALRDLAHNPVAFVLISIFGFCCRVSHTPTVSGD